MDNSAELVFLPANKLETGTIYIVFCAYGHMPEVSYGAMECDNNGNWINAPTCVKEPTMSTAEPTPINQCTASLLVDNAASIIFIPANNTETGTAFVVFCKPGYDPKKEFGTMECNEEGVWTNVPVCSQSTIYQRTTALPDPSEVQTTDAIQYETTTTEFIFSESDQGNLYSCEKHSVTNLEQRKPYK